MGSTESKRVENTGEVINEIISLPNDNSQDSSIKIMLMIITGIMIIQLLWKIHKGYRYRLKKKYASSARIAEI